MELTVDTFLTELKSQAGYSEHTLQAYASDIRRFIEYLRKTLKHPPDTEDFNTENTKRFLDSEKKAGMRESTIFRRRASLRRFANYLNETGGLDFDPTKDYILRTPTRFARFKSPKAAKVLSANEIESIFLEINATVNPRKYRDLALINILFETGISIGELVRLNISDLNLRAMQIRISRNGQPDGTSLGIDESVNSIRKYLHESRPGLTDSTNELALFVSQLGGRMSRQGIWQILRNWGERAGMDQILSPRMIRHSAVIRMVSDGLSVAEIQHLLGHRNQFSTKALLRRLKNNHSK